MGLNYLTLAFLPQALQNDLQALQSSHAELIAQLEDAQRVSEFAVISCRFL